MIRKKTESEKLQDELEPIDFKEQADKEQKELDESMKESFRQRDERKAKERLKNENECNSEKVGATGGDSILFK